MHEMAMVRSVVDIVLEEAEHAGATEVLGVYLTVGYSRDIVEDVFESMFAWMCRGTVAEGAVLHLTRVPFTVRCVVGDTRFQAHRFSVLCRLCFRLKQVQTFRGKAL